MGSLFFKQCMEQQKPSQIAQSPVFALMCSSFKQVLVGPTRKQITLMNSLFAKSYWCISCEIIL